MEKPLVERVTVSRSEITLSSLSRNGSLDSQFSLEGGGVRDPSFLGVETDSVGVGL